MNKNLYKNNISILVHGVTSEPTKQIHNKNLLKKALRIESPSLPAWICKDSFRAIVLRISQDSWGFIGFVKTGWIFKNRTRESGFANLWSRICQSRNEANLFGVRIRDYNTKWMHGFAKRIHVFTNLLYDFRILHYFLMTDCNVRLFFWGRGGGHIIARRPPRKGSLMLKLKINLGLKKLLFYHI
jgi:hypothetical protein